ncbi:hypothetical protein [uncultured Vagococcus sp.]|uniref:hypothetical protein n=1 Tax=uncultured Vagococcus sp. TaxID=189676 RepID=UPI0028D51613|nr:hypothetical protein [uncultured Vagococcus sp.]
MGKVVQRISLSENQAVGILSDMITNSGLTFKVVYFSSPGYESTRENFEGDAATAVVADLLSGLDLKNMRDTQIVDHVITKLGANKNFKRLPLK